MKKDRRRPAFFLSTPTWNYLDGDTEAAIEGADEAGLMMVVLPPPTPNQWATARP
jgi:hypothetical protein